MDQSLNMQFVMMRANAEKKAAHSERLGQEHVFLGLLKLAELNAADMYNAPDYILKDCDEDIARVRTMFSEKGIDTTRTRGHLRYMISNGAAADEPAMEKTLTAAARMAESLHIKRLTAALVLRAIMNAPSDLILQVCPIAMEQEESEDQPDEMSRAYLPKLTSDLRNMRAQLLSRVFGQDHVVHAFVEGMFAAEVLAASDDKRVRPRAIFVFAGPPGVGKTFLAEQAAAAINIPVKRFDMTSYADHQSYMGLIGFEKSYHEAKKGTLTGFVRSNPHSFLLFDEIEKAHTNTINLFLQILDAGRLHDRYLDEDVSFKDTIIIFTTNAGKSLYDGDARENAAGVPRRILLSALETEINPQTERPYFPEAITSRMATGWPLLFNHLQAHHLKQIISGEFARMSQLFEKQYGIRVKYDSLVPASLLLQEGGLADARTLRAQAEMFFKNEVFKLCRLWGEDHFSRALEGIEALYFRVREEQLPDEIFSLFNSRENPEVLLYASQEFASKFRRELPQYVVYSTQNMDEALSIAGEKDIRLALIELSVKSVTDSSYGLLQKSYFRSESKTVSVSSMIGFDYSPITDTAITDGNRLFRALRERLPEIPVYLLETGDFKIDTELEMSFIRAGARGKLEANREEFSVLEDQLNSISQELYIQKTALKLSNERKAVSFDTIQQLRNKGKEVLITLKDYSIKRMISANDSESVLEDVEKPRVRFSDVVGAQQAKDELQFFVEYLKNPRRFSAQGLKPPKGVLLYGQPGTGKTMLARAMAGESNAAFIATVASYFVTKYQGSGPEAVKNLFQRARKYAPSIIFIDEIDAIGRKRGHGNTGHGEEMALNALLSEMDGFSVDPKRPVFVLAATNFQVDSDTKGMGVIDPALSRRFDCKVMVDLPDEEEREAFIRMSLARLKKHDVSSEMMKRIASRSVGMSPSWLSSVMEMANRIAVKAGTLINDSIIDEAYETVRHGTKKEWGLEYLERVARHESGHAFINYLNGNTPAYLTIIARGNHGGYMEHAAEEQKPLQTKKELLDRVRTALGGRAAEIVYYGEKDGLSTGASGDLKQAGKIAEAIVCEYGMEEDLGLYHRDNEALSEPAIRKINHILNNEMQTAMDLISENREKIDILVGLLLKKNKLTGTEIEDALQ